MEFMSMMIAFAPLFSQRVWPQALTLVMGARIGLDRCWFKSGAGKSKRNVSMILRQSDGEISVDPPELIERRVEED